MKIKKKVFIKIVAITHMETHDKSEKIDKEYRDILYGRGIELAKKILNAMNTG